MLSFPLAWKALPLRSSCDWLLVVNPSQLKCRFRREAFSEPANLKYLQGYEHTTLIFLPYVIYHSLNVSVYVFVYLLFVHLFPLNVRSTGPEHCLTWPSLCFQCLIVDTQAIFGEWMNEWCTEVIQERIMGKKKTLSNPPGRVRCPELLALMLWSKCVIMY